MQGARKHFPMSRNNLEELMASLTDSFQSITISMYCYFYMYQFEFIKLPLDTIERDPEQPREDLHIYDRFGAELQSSIQERGILIPLAVRALEGGRYMVIDGHRRLICAQRLGLLSAPCQVYNNLTVAEVWRLRFELQDNWLPAPGFRSKVEERKRKLALMLAAHNIESLSKDLPGDELATL